MVPVPRDRKGPLDHRQVGSVTAGTVASSDPQARCRHTHPGRGVWSSHRVKTMAIPPPAPRSSTNSASTSTTSSPAPNPSSPDPLGGRLAPCRPAQRPQALASSRRVRHPPSGALRTTVHQAVTKPENTVSRRGIPWGRGQGPGRDEPRGARRMRRYGCGERGVVRVLRSCRSGAGCWSASCCQ